MTHKLVSIIVPTFNRASLVVEAIRSAQAQIYPAKQIIVIDDGSLDDTEQVVAQFEGIEYYRQENKGQAAARNLGLHYAKGEYIATLDSDDVWHENFLSCGIRCLETHDLDFVFLNWILTNGNESFLDSWMRNNKWGKTIAKLNDDWLLLDAEHLRLAFLESCPAPSSALLIRRSSLISSWNEEMIIADDWFLVLEMVLSKPCRAAFTLTPHWSKRMFGDNIFDGADWFETTKSLGLHDERIIAEHFNSILTPAEKSILRRRLARHYFNFGGLSWKHKGLSRNMFSGIANAFALSPVRISFYTMQLSVHYIKKLAKKLFSQKAESAVKEDEKKIGREIHGRAP